MGVYKKGRHWYIDYYVIEFCISNNTADRI